LAVAHDGLHIDGHLWHVRESIPDAVAGRPFDSNYQIAFQLSQNYCEDELDGVWFEAERYRGDSLDSDPHLSLVLDMQFEGSITLLGEFLQHGLAEHHWLVPHICLGNDNLGKDIWALHLGQLLHKTPNNIRF